MIHVWENDDERSILNLIYKGQDKKEAKRLVKIDTENRWLEEVYTEEERAGW